jgi:hypothetical protein
MNQQGGYPQLTPVSLALVAVGTGLVVFLAGVCVIVAVGKTVPSELWSSGSALSGGLLGLLVPSPSSSATVNSPPPAGGAASPAGAPPAPAAPLAGAPPAPAAPLAVKGRGAAAGPEIGALKGFFVDMLTNRTALTLLIVFAGAILVPLFTSAGESTELHALAAGAAAALLGMLAPPPTQK